MKTQTIKSVAAALVIALVAGAVGYGIALNKSRDPAPALKSESGTKERQVLYWYDPMKPDQHFDKPGKSPFMDMDLVPKYADQAEAVSGGVRIAPDIRQNLGVRLTEVEEGSLDANLNAAASVQFNERDVAVVQARSGGFVERVYARAPGDIVAAGAPLADVLVPEWAAAQTEFLAVLDSGDKSLIEAVRQRLRLTGMPPALIARAEKTRRPQAVTTITAPIGGVLQSLDVRNGMTLAPGMTLATINGLHTVWLEAAVPEAQAGSIKLDQSVEARFTAYPGEVFPGKVIAVLPQANAENRTLRVRVELDNRQQRLRPGMFAQLQIQAGAQEKALLVPTEALIRTGLRIIVILAENDRFLPVEVETGREGQGKTIILGGLQVGQKVVASGQFLIDSEASLQGVIARLSADKAAQHRHETAQPSDSPRAQRTSTLHRGVGRVERIHGQQITLSHEPIPALDWPAMTMPFDLHKADLAKGFKAGDEIEFDFAVEDESAVIHALRKKGTQP